VDIDPGSRSGLAGMSYDATADALLPVVRHLVAEELRAIVLDAQIVGEVMHERGPIRVPVTYLEEIAAALDATPDHGKA